MAKAGHPIPGGRAERTLPTRFWAKVDKTGECWLWTATTNSSGYGAISTGGNTYLPAHRFSWELANGTRIPDGLFVLHSCDVKRCVRPDHLRVGTVQENTDDYVRRALSGKPKSYWGRFTQRHRSLIATAESVAVDIQRVLDGQDVDLAETLTSLREAISEARKPKRADRG